MAYNEFGGTQSIVSLAKYNATVALSVAAVNGIKNGLRASGAQMPQVLQALSQALDVRAIPENRVKAVNITLARGAHAAMAEGWRQRLPLNGPSYGEGRRLTGRLKPALENEAMNIRGTSDRLIAFLDVNHLNEQAKHWQRVNYGSGGAAHDGREAGTYEVVVNSVAVLQLRDETPPANLHLLPKNFYWKGDQGFPGRYRGREDLIIGKGTRAARFTDLGLEKLAKTIGPAYHDLFVNYIGTEAGTAKMKLKNIKIGAHLGSVEQQVRFD